MLKSVLIYWCKHGALVTWWCNESAQFLLFIIYLQARCLLFIHTYAYLWKCILKGRVVASAKIAEMIKLICESNVQTISMDENKPFKCQSHVFVGPLLRHRRVFKWSDTYWYQAISKKNDGRIFFYFIYQWLFVKFRNSNTIFVMVNEISQATAALRGWNHSPSYLYCYVKILWIRILESNPRNVYHF